MKALFALLLIGICQALHQAHILDRRQALATAGAVVMASYQPINRFWLLTSRLFLMSLETETETSKHW
jgi:hypothetical protein